MKKKIVSDSIFLTVGEFLIRLKGIIFLPPIISTLGLEDYGIFVQILINQALITYLCSLALGMGFFRYTSQFGETEREEISIDFWTVFHTSLFLSLVGAGIVYISGPVLSKQILGGKSLEAIRLSSIMIIINVLWTQLSRFIQSRKKFKLYSIFNICFQLVPYFGFIIGIMIVPTVFFGLLFYISVQLITIIILFIYIFHDTTYCFINYDRLRKFIKYCWPLTFSWMNVSLLSKMDRYFIGYFLGPIAIGIYNIIYAVASFLDMYTVPFRKYFGVYLPQSWDRGQNQRVKQQIREGLLFYLIISIGSLVGMTYYLKPAIILILNKSLSLINNFNLLVFVTGLGILWLGVSRFFEQIIHYEEKNRFKLLYQTIGVLINFGLNYMLIPVYGLLGAGLSTLISYSIIILFLNIKFSIDINYKFIIKIFKICIVSTAIILVYQLIEVKNILFMLVSISTSIIFYATGIILMRIIPLRAFINKYFSK